MSTQRLKPDEGLNNYGLSSFLGRSRDRDLSHLDHGSHNGAEIESQKT